MERQSGNAALALIAVLGAALVTGCASSPVERQRATVDSLVQLHDTVAATEQHIEQTLAGLLALMHAPPAQVTQAYTRYASQANAMAAQAGRIQAEAASLRDRRESWLAGWNASYTEVRDPQLRSLTEERRQQIAQYFERIEASLGLALESLGPFVENVEDIKEVAGNDLSPLGLQALSRTEVVRNATDHGRGAAQALRASTNDLQALIQSLAPARAARTAR
jgi:hypothetical protein